MIPKGCEGALGTVKEEERGFTGALMACLPPHVATFLSSRLIVQQRISLSRDFPFGASLGIFL